MLSTANLASMGSRINIWRAAVALFFKHPIFGVGPAACNYYVQEFLPSTMIDAHNFLLEKLCNGGLIGASIYLLPLLTMLYQIIKMTMLDPARLPYPEGGDELKPSVTLTALNNSMLFMIVSVFVNSSFSPHYVMPLLSVLLYIIFGIYSAVVFDPRPPSPILELNDINFADKFLKVVKFIIILIITYYTLAVIIIKFPPEIFAEISLWLMPTSVIISMLLFNCHFEKKVNLNIPPLNKLSGSLASALIIIFMMFYYIGFKFYIAEKANVLGIQSAINYSVSGAEHHFSTALAYDPDNIAYLLNKSCILFVSEFVKGNQLNLNPKINDSLELIKKCKKIFSLDQLIENNYVLVNAKYNKINDYKPFLKAFESEETELKLNDTDCKLIIENPNNCLARYSDIFSADAYKKFIKANALITNEINKLSPEMLNPDSEYIIGQYINYAAVMFRLASNVKVNFAENFMIKSVSDAFKSVEYAGKFIPSSKYKEYTVQYDQQYEILSAAAFVLPVIWKYSHGLSKEQAREQFTKMFGNSVLFHIFEYFLYNDETALRSFGGFEPELKDSLLFLTEFSRKNFDNAVKIQEINLKKSLTPVNAILLSWAYYKTGRIKSAREVVLFSQLNTIQIARRDFTFKRELLFGGNLLGFYYLPLQAYYNEFIMLALIKLHNGDHTMVLKEVFDYLNTVIYNQ